jgi:hypothetical chaperone protein
LHAQGWWGILDDDIGESHMRLGIDFGTTNSSIAFYDGHNLAPVRLDPEGDNPYILPSLIYVDRDHRAVLGTAAAAEYLRRETGRPVKWEKRPVGEVEVVVGGGGSAPIRYVQPMSVIVDTAANGRLLQSIKTALRDPAYDGTEIFDRFYTLDELVAIVLRALREAAERTFVRDCRSVVLGRPVRFSDDAAVTARGEEILFKAARLAGFDDVAFQLEPIGAAYLRHVSVSERETALLFDFGGGTLDLTVAELGGGQEPQVLANSGVLVGGDDLDQRLMRHLMRHLGTEAPLRGGQSFPFEIVKLLATWQTMPELSRPAYRDFLDELEQASTAPRSIGALRTLVSHNLGFELFQEIERAKKHLSRSPTAGLNLARDGIAIHELLTRARFEALIAPDIERVEAGVAQVLADARLGPDRVDVVLRTGGSSMVPAFVDLLERLFGAGKVIAMDPLRSVVGGLAVVAHEGEGIRPAYAAGYPATGHPVIRDVATKNGKSYETYEMHVGARCYLDADFYTVTRLPVVMSGLPAVRTANLDREEVARKFLRFFIDEPARVFVAYKAGASQLPEWLQSFVPTEMQVEVSQWRSKMAFPVYRKDFPSGKVMLGANHAPPYSGQANMNYLVVVRQLGEHSGGSAEGEWGLRR